MLLLGLALGEGSPGYFFDGVSIACDFCVDGEIWGVGGRMYVRRGADQALHVADKHAVVEECARLITVADVVEGFGAVLAGEIEEDFLTATVGLVSLVVLGFDVGR